MEHDRPPDLAYDVQRAAPGPDELGSCDAVAEVDLTPGRPLAALGSTTISADLPDPGLALRLRLSLREEPAAERVRLEVFRGQSGQDFVFKIGPAQDARAAHQRGLAARNVLPEDGEVMRGPDGVSVIAVTNRGGD